MSTLYTARAKAVGGRSGRVSTDDGLLDVGLALPRALGGKEDATNPEQLFAAGYAACFENAVIHVARGLGAKIPDDAIVVDAVVGIGPNATGGFALSVDLNVAIAGLAQDKAEEIVAAAHATCPYSNAVKGNIDVGLNVTTS